MKKRYFEAAKKMSLRSTHHQHKLGCVIVNKNKIIGMGFNKLKTHPDSNHPYKSTHAEFHAICNVLDVSMLKNADIYVYRATRNGKEALAKPCRYCEQLIRRHGIARIFYTEG